MKSLRRDILDFWFEQTTPAQWFQVNPDFDAEVKSRFENFCVLAADGAYDDWKTDPEGCLALCILLDQFPRNIWRGSARAFQYDAKALVIAKFAVAKGFDQILPVLRRRFLYLPYEHSENLNDQKKCVELFEKIKKDDPMGYDYALRHLKVIEDFGRFPHRNAVLGRMSTPEEQEYLALPGAGF